jgi:pyrroline-5-carboxylate reductase
MKIGLIGAGAMATALARGWSQPVIVSDPDQQRAARLAGELEGLALPNNVDVASQADVVILCHKPAQLEEVAAEIDGVAKAVVSILGSVDLETIRGAYTESPAYRVLPNLPVELGAGVLCWPAENGSDGNEIRDYFAKLGDLVEMPESEIEAAMTMSSNAPGWLAFIVESFVAAGAGRGLSQETASRLVVKTLSGTAALLEARDGDAERLRLEVCSPGGSTERGVAAMREARLPEAIQSAVDAVLKPNQ